MSVPTLLTYSIYEQQLPQAASFYTVTPAVKAFLVGRPIAYTFSSYSHWCWSVGRSEQAIPPLELANYLCSGSLNSYLVLHKRDVCMNDCNTPKY